MPACPVVLLGPHTDCDTSSPPAGHPAGLATATQCEVVAVTRLPRCGVGSANRARCHICVDENLTHPVQQDVTCAADFSWSLGVIDGYIMFISYAGTVKFRWDMHPLGEGMPRGGGRASARRSAARNARLCELPRSVPWPLPRRGRGGPWKRRESSGARSAVASRGRWPRRTPVFPVHMHLSAPGIIPPRRPTIVGAILDQP